MSSLLPHKPGGGAAGSENQTTAVRVCVCGSNDKSEHYHRPLANRIKTESVWQPVSAVGVHALAGFSIRARHCQLTTMCDSMRP